MSAEQQEAAGAVKAAEIEAGKVVKKQKTCCSHTSLALEKLIRELEVAQERILNDQTCDPHAVLRDLWAQVEQLNVVQQISNNTKELHGSVSKLGKALDKSFTLDICKAVRGAPMDASILNHVIAEHLYHEGAFTVGDAFVQEAQVPEAAQLRTQYESMHAVLEQILIRNLQPALDWIEKHATKLRGSGGEPCAFEFSVHRLAFLQTLQQHGETAALEYGRKNFPVFMKSHMAQVQRLMGAICFARRAATGGGPGPYADLFNEESWGKLARDFVRQSCGLLGQAQDSPLLVTAAAGSAALPTLLKLASVVSAAPVADLAGRDQLPVEIPLGKEFIFHSIFACPVSREQSTPDNPPMMLPCGHCICKHSILKIAKSATRAFKCPYCPVEATISQCRELHFPDLLEN